jgi:hypothetical protein
VYKLKKEESYEKGNMEGGDSGHHHDPDRH